MYTTRLSLFAATEYLVLAVPAQAADPSTQSTQQGSQDTSTAMHHDMMSGMKDMHAMKPTGDADADFAHMMEHHHAQAVKMTQTYLRGAKDPALKAWAQESLKSQQQELDELRKIRPASGKTGS
jgi:uncharacterized protein (DUF305 family)